MSAAYPQRAIQEVDFKKNIQDVWVKVKWEQSGKTAYFTEGGGEEKTAFALAYEEAQRERDALRISIAEPVEQTETLLAVHNKDWGYIRAQAIILKNEAVPKVAGRVQFPTQPTKGASSGILLHDVGEKVNLKVADPKEKWVS